MLRKFKSILSIVLISLISLNCIEEPAIFSEKPGQVLFAGNSLTYFNEMPLIFDAIGAAFDFKLKSDVMAYPNYALEDHWKEGQLRNFLNANEYEFVVFQQGPSSQEYGRTSLLEYGGAISEHAKSQNTVPVFYMVWPSIAYYGTFEGVIANYTAAAEAADARLAPVGAHWQLYRTRQNGIDLYGPDQFHPSKAGSFLAALTIFHTLYPQYDLMELEFRDFREYVDQEFAFNELVEMVAQ